MSAGTAAQNDPFCLIVDGIIDTQVLSALIKDEVQACSVREHAKLGGMSGEFVLLEVILSTGREVALILKSAPKERLERAKVLGTAREALFYKLLAPTLTEAGVPRAWYAHGNMETGEMIVLMEYFEGAVPAGVFFGPGNPNNWSHKDALTDMCIGNPSANEVSMEAFRLYARLHASHWGGRELLGESWLRGSDWSQGKGRDSWEASQKMASDAWDKLSAARRKGTSSLSWDPHVIACLDASFAKVSWAEFQKEQAGRPLTLVHGDCHPHNNLWVNQRSQSARLCLIDFEMVGLGSNAQELGQYLISHMRPDARRACERDLVAAYHAELTTRLRERSVAEAESYTLDACWSEYVAGGAGRWAWFVPYLASAMPELGQFFHDQLAAFLHDHVQDASKAPMPRV